MAPKSKTKSAPRVNARSMNSLRGSQSARHGQTSPGGAVELHGRSLKESLPGPNQIGCVRDYAARWAGGEENLKCAEGIFSMETASRQVGGFAGSFLFHPNFARRSRTRSLRALPSTDFPSSADFTAFTTAPICFMELAPVSAIALSMAVFISSWLALAGR